MNKYLQSACTVLTFLLFSLIVVPGTIFACATIESVRTNVTEVESGKPYTCTVTVGSGDARSKTIACGIAFNDGYPLDYCPSDEFFGGWSGNNAGFNCVFPSTNIPDSITKVELVGYDFASGCGPEQGKRITVSLKKDSSIATNTPKVDPADQTDDARTLLREIFEKIFAGSGGNGSSGNTYPGTGTGGSGGADDQDDSFSIDSKGFVYYCQGDPKWKDTCQLGNAGCGPTTTAMILASFGIKVNELGIGLQGDRLATPPDVDKVFQLKGWRSCGMSGSNLRYGALTSSWFTKEVGGQGFIIGEELVSSQNLNLTKAKEYINNGYLIFASSQTYPCAGCVNKYAPVDHIISIQDVDPAKGTVLVRDSNNCSYSSGIEFSTDRVISESKIAWYYALPVKRRGYAPPKTPTPTVKSTIQ